MKKLRIYVDTSVIGGCFDRSLKNLDKMRLFSAVNPEHGYKALSIYSPPREVISCVTEE
ncbi:MAG: hypothetical protein NG747_11515 [Candidatus Brocadia sp.]|nr:hypothetical protein [Candidatus Brocadia sp.]